MRQSRILIRIADKRRGIGHKQILHFMRLAIFVQRGGARIAPHADRAQLMNDLAADAEMPSPSIGFGRGRGNFPPMVSRIDRERLVHVLRLLQFVIGPLEMEPQHRNAALIHYLGIDLAVGVFDWGSSRRGRPSPRWRRTASRMAVFEILAIAFVPRSNRHETCPICGMPKPPPISM